VCVSVPKCGRPACLASRAGIRKKGRGPSAPLSAVGLWLHGQEEAFVAHTGRGGAGQHRGIEIDPTQSLEDTGSEDASATLADGEA
jgi:hypothetical protein